MLSAFVLLMGSQVLWKVLIVHRFSGNPLHNFIDLLFLANTSAIIMEDRHSGYYLHGRNQMHHSGELGRQGAIMIDECC
jgi:meckelin